jgi:hypothetical protein
MFLGTPTLFLGTFWFLGKAPSFLGTLTWFLGIVVGLELSGRPSRFIRLDSLFGTTSTGREPPMAGLLPRTSLTCPGSAEAPRKGFNDPGRGLVLSWAHP